MSRSRDYGIRDWFWPRNSPNIPPELASGEPFLEEPSFPTCSWGEPAAAFPIDPTHCDYDQHFNVHMIMFSMTFCVRDFSPVFQVSRAQLRHCFFYRVIGPAMSGPHPAASVVMAPVRTVSIH
jgi:hypothetical protein